MSDLAREEKIMEILNAENSVSVNKLMKLLYVSQATIRRDLTEMAKKGLLKRTHGGAILFSSTSEESSIVIRTETMKREKRMICEKALDYIKNNDSIFLDPSSTVCTIVPLLVNFRYLTIISNSLNAAMAIGQKTNFKVFIPSGFLKAQSNSILGDSTSKVISDIHCDIFLFSAAGIDTDRGLTEATIEQAEMKKIMCRNSRKRILLLDHTKFEQSFLAKSIDLMDVDVLITDRKPSEEYIRFLSQYKLELVWCE